MIPLPAIKLGIYRHYKGDEYEVIGVGRDSDSLKPLVIYRGLYNSEEFGNNPLWARPAKEFEEIISVDGKEMPRFEFIR